MSDHPQSHLWAALQRRFADQRSPAISPDRLLRGMCIEPLDGQENSQTFALGFREVGTVVRTVSLSRDFHGMSELVERDRAAYLVVFIGDVQKGPRSPKVGEGGDWLLVAYVPSMCSAFEAKRMADARNALKADLGAAAFADAGMWVVSPDQITLSNCMRALDGGGSGEAAAAASALITQSRREAAQVDDLTIAPLAPGDATDDVWEERIKGLRIGYNDSCTRLVGALEELEQTLCSLTGDEYRKDEPLLHARAHMGKVLELAKKR